MCTTKTKDTTHDHYFFGKRCYFGVPFQRLRQIGESPAMTLTSFGFDTIESGDELCAVSPSGSP